MANEITFNFSGQLANGSLKDLFQPSTLLITQTTALADVQTATVLSASEGDIAFASVTTNGYLIMQNLDSTNFVQYGPKSGGVMIATGKLKAGEIAIWRMMTGVTLRMKADTANCKVMIRAYNN